MGALLLCCRNMSSTTRSACCSFACLQMPLRSWGTLWAAAVLCAQQDQRAPAYSAAEGSCSRLACSPAGSSEAEEDPLGVLGSALGAAKMRRSRFPRAMTSGWASRSHCGTSIWATPSRSASLPVGLDSCGRCCRAHKCMGRLRLLACWCSPVPQTAPA